MTYRGVNALAETTNGLYKTECVYGPDAPRPWNDVDELELATLSWAHWYNQRRLHSTIDYNAPVEFEAIFNRHGDRLAAQPTRPSTGSTSPLATARCGSRINRRRQSSGVAALRSGTGFPPSRSTDPGG
ncbi:integrase core domain-containing protein [Desertimonas flava]|uniref:integrase core domain-containing protein n=1 Tax=Desertimonas flava TaxID=2064846 RepID=UPI000E3517CB